MSYILEALKKSDREYRLQQGADIDRLHFAAVDSRVSRRPRAWIIVFLALLLLTAGLGRALWPGALRPLEQDATPAGSSDANEATAAVGPLDSPSPAPAPGAQDPAPLHAMPPQLRSRLGPLQFSLHVYSPQAGQRSIIINNRMMREGEWLDAGLQLREITEGGVIMAIDGQLYRMSVVSDWKQ